MKKVLLLLGIIITSLSIYSKRKEINDDMCKYKIVYNYLLNDTILIKDFNFLSKNTIVSDSIVFIHRSFFYQEYKKVNETDKDALSRMIELDNKEWHTPFYSSKIYEIFHNDNIKNPSFILYFSKIDNDFLLCEVLQLRNLLNLSYTYNINFNQSYQYLFIFNKNNLIVNVIKKKMAYN